MVSSDVKKNFSAFDFAVFTVLIGVSAVVGIFFGYKDRKKLTTANYYFGGRKMNPVAVAMSISGTFVSALTIIGIPSEAYIIGTVQLWYCFMCIFAALFVAIYLIPLFYRLKIQSIFEFLELRYNKTTRRIFASTQVLSKLIYLGLIVFLPSLALTAVTPIPLYWSIAVTTILCTFYTTLGGMKAVIWTDVIQTAVIVIGCLTIFAKVIIAIGGFDELTASLKKGQRFNALDPDFDITSRKSPIAMVIGWLASFVGSLSFSQHIVQRVMSCKSVKSAQCAMISSSLPSFLITLLATGNGLAMYAYYEGCDPVKSGMLHSADQGMPYMALAVSRNLPGIAGLFIASIYCGTLSTVSSLVNSFSVVVVEDFLLQKWPNMTERTKLLTGKICAAAIGAVGMLMAFLVSFMKSNAIKIAMVILGVIDGPYFGICLLGAFFPWATTLGALVGAGFAYALLLFLVVGSFSLRHVGSRVALPPTDTDSCAPNITSTPVFATTTWHNLTASPDISKYTFDQVLYNIHFLYYFGIAYVITILLGLAVSFLTGARKPIETDPNLFVPIIDNPLFSAKVRKFFRFGVCELDKWDKDNVGDDAEMEMEV